MANNSPQAKQAAQLRAMAAVKVSSGSGKPAQQGVVQRKIMIGKTEYQKKAQDGDKIAGAVSDEFIRYYANEEQMKGHLENNTPSSFGLIKKRALWYDIPYLTKEFFVLGESHAGVKGPDIKEASNIQKPISYEAYTGWDVKDYDKDPGGGDQGTDENSSKLLRALVVWDPAGLAGVQPQAPSSGPEKIPEIPSGEKSTRKTDDGSYRLVIKGEDFKEKWWTEKGKDKPPVNDYDANQQALDAIKGLFEIVFKEEIEKSALSSSYGDKFGKAWGYLKNDTWKNADKSQHHVILKNIRNFLYEGVLEKVKNEYGKLHQVTDTQIKAVDDPALKGANDYRNEFMFTSIVKGSKTDKFAFAAIGDGHLKDLKGRLDTANVKYVTMEDFYNKYSRDAVDIPDRRTPWEGNFSTIEHLDFGNLVTNQTNVIVEAVEAGKIPKLKKLTIHEKSMTPELRGRLISCGIKVNLIR
ncbi:MAG TPA: hypothetical protein VIU45_04540 [Chitinophagaceae bacterium]